MNRLMLGILVCASCQAQAQSSAKNTNFVEKKLFDLSMSEVSFGIHGSLYKPANIISADQHSSSENINGVIFAEGLEASIPYSEYLDYRLSIRNIPFKASDDKNNGHWMLSLEMINQFEILPIYFVSGVNYLDRGNVPLSLNVGTGFRMQFSESAFSYIESKLFWNLGGGTDFAINFGVVYRFINESHPIRHQQKYRKLTEVTKASEVVKPTVVVSNDQVIRSETSEPAEIAQSEQTEQSIQLGNIPVIDSKPGFFETVGAVFIGMFDSIASVFTFSGDSSNSDTQQETVEDSVIVQELPPELMFKPFSECISETALLSGKEFVFYFAENALELSVDNKARLTCIADVLKEHFDTRLYLDGYISDSDTPNRKLHLSYTRAVTVQKYLSEEHGISKSRIRITRHSRADDFDPQIDGDNQQGDRRVGYRLIVVE